MSKIDKLCLALCPMLLPKLESWQYSHEATGHSRVDRHLYISTGALAFDKNLFKKEDLP